MEKKICLITGATSGIGRATAIELARLKFNLILTGRNIKNGFKLARNLEAKFNTEVEFLKADISSLKEVKSLAEKIKNNYNRIDVLINNAGSRFADHKKSTDGIELTFATNHLGHFYLTLSLLELLKNSPSARIINVSSSAHFGKTINFDEITNPKHYDRSTAYGQSKLANLFFTYELARKLINTKITVNALDPGGVASNLGRNDGLISWAKHIGYYLLKRQLLTPRQGAETSVYLASSQEVEGITGKYFFNKKEKESSPQSYDKEAAKKLWELSLNSCGMESGKI